MDRWWMVPHATRAIDEVLFTLNRSHREAEAIEKCELRFKAINQLFSAYEECVREPGDDSNPAQHRSLQRLMTSGLPTEASLNILEDPNVAALALFKPRILDHYKLRGFRFTGDIPEEIRELAGDQHRSLCERFEAFNRQNNSRNRNKTLEALADTLWMVRSNIAHGEKTVAGPDPQRNERNRAVAKVALPVLDCILEVVLANPSCSLISYGTLAPGQVNEGLLDDIDGSWVDAEVNGERWDDEDGLPRFRWQPDMGSSVATKLLRSNDLPEKWHQLDAFEGNSYRRILVRYVTKAGLGVGTCYEDGA